VAELAAFWSGRSSHDGLARFVAYRWIPFVSPPAAVAAAAVVLTAGGRRGLKRGGRAWGTLLLVLVSIGLFNQALNRIDRIHLLPAAITSVLLVSALVYCLPAGWPRRYAVLTILLLAPFWAPFYIYQPIDVARSVLFLPGQSSCPGSSSIAKAGCGFVFPDQAQAVQFIQSHTGTYERIFVGSSRHDRMFANDALFYFLAERRNATRYDDLVSGRVTTRLVQETIIDDLRRRGVNWIVLYSGFERVVEANESGRSTGVILLDEFIRREYRLVERFGTYTIWERR